MIAAPVTLFLFLHIVGVLLGRLSKRHIPLGLFCCSGLLWGLLVYVILAMLVLALHLPYTAPVMGILLAAVLITLLVLNLRRHPFSRAELGWIALSGLVCMLLASVFSYFNFSLMSSDSSAMIIMGRSLALHGGFDLNIAGVVSIDMGWFSNYGSLVPIIQSTAVFIGLDYHFAITPLLVVSFLSTFVFAARYGLRLSDAPIGVPTLHAALGGVFLASTFMFTMQAVYIHNNIYSAVYLFLFVAMAWFGIVRQQPVWFAFAIPALLVFSGARVEAPLFAVLFLTLLISHPAVSYRTRLWCVLPFVAFLLLWYVTLYRITISPRTYILTHERNLIMMGGLIAYAAFVVLSRFRWCERILRAAPWLIVYALALAVLAAWLVKPEHMASGLHALLTNMTRTGAWIASWCALAVLLAFASLLPRIPLERIYTCGMSAAFLLLYALGALKNHRLAWADSQNRMLTHIFPLAVFYVLLKYAPWARLEVRLPARSRKRCLAVGTFALVFLLVMSISGTKRRNYALEANVLEEPECAKRYEFYVAVRGTTRFCSATERCPSTAIVDMGKEIEADMFELEFQALQWAFEDYALHLSRDRRQWVTLFDARVPDRLGTYWIDDRTIGFDLRPFGPLRYIRLTVRSAKGQNRIVLTRLRVWSSAPAAKWRAPADLPLIRPREHLAQAGGDISRTQEVDWAVGATMIQGPLFDKEHDFSRALNGKAEEKFARAAERGPATVVVDLGWTVNASTLETVAVEEDRRPTDYAWHVSADGQQWLEVYDTRTASSGPSIDQGSLVERFALPAETPIRFLRLTFRAARKSSPLQLRRVSLLQALHAADEDALGAPVDYAVGATVLEQPQCAPGYEFDVALRGAVDGRFVSAVERCPSEVVFGWQQPVVADWLDVLEHDPGRGLRDFAWYWSEDGQTWHVLLDSRIGGTCRRWPGAPARYALRLPDVPVRWLRLAARYAAVENRLLMERIRVWSSLARDERGAPARMPVWTPADHVLAKLPAWLARQAVDWADGALVTSASDGVRLVPDEPLTRQRPDAEAVAQAPVPRPLATIPPNTPLSAILDLGWRVHADRVEVEFDPPGPCQLAVSLDGVDWTAAPWAATPPESVVNAFSLERLDKFRFVRVEAEPRSVPGVLSDVRALSPLGPALRAAHARAAEQGIALDLAIGARVTQAPLCVPGYEFAVALRGRRDGRFVSAVERCPSTVVLDLGRPCSAELVVLYGHDTLRAFADYAIHASVDRKAWVEVFDARGERRMVFRLSDTTTGFQLDPDRPLRYLRLTVRSAKSENRILLNGLSVLSRFDGDALPEPTQYPRLTPVLDAASPSDARYPLDTSGLVDLALGATAVEGPLFADGHDFARAVRGVLDAEYSALATPGRATVVVDLGWTVRASRVKLYERDAESGLEYVALAVSGDRETWTEVPATVEPSRTDDSRSDGAARAFDVSNRPAFRYLRILFRNEGGEGRFVLRRLRVIP